MINSQFSQKVLAVVAKIPKGKTMTYKQVAKAAGSAGAYRAVGNVLNKNYVRKFLAIASFVLMESWVAGIGE